MFNLYRISYLLMLLASPFVSAYAQSSFINEVTQFVAKGFEDNQSAQTQWLVAQKEGMLLVEDQPDQVTRPFFTTVQFNVEQAMVNRLQQSKGKAKALWIIHTPLMANPLVTESSVSATGKDRAVLIRQFLEAGGVLVTAYSKQANLQRTPTETAIFEALYRRYPNQLINFAIDSSLLPASKYPSEKCGATYIFQDASGEIFEMTNLGAQSQDRSRNAPWGVWWHERSASKPVVTARIQTILQFLHDAKFDVSMLPSTHAALLSK